jgi:hypothetical protein
MLAHRQVPARMARQAEANQILRLVVAVVAVNVMYLGPSCSRAILTRAIAAQNTLP